MYEPHPEFKPPPSEAALWRYMDFTKFASLLDKEALFFARADKLGDPVEGSFSKVNDAMRPTWLLDQGAPPEQIQEIIQLVSTGNKAMPSRVFVNCWHENDYESEAMRKLYGNGAGISIKTTFKALSESFTSSDHIHIGRISYVDYDTTAISEQNAFSAFLNKRKSFEHEREVRAVVSNFSSEAVPVRQY